MICVQYHAQLDDCVRLIPVWKLESREANKFKVFQMVATLKRAKPTHFIKCIT